MGFLMAYISTFKKLLLVMIQLIEYLKKKHKNYFNRSKLIQFFFKSL